MRRYQWHKNISIPLHAFALGVMAQRFDNKIYMINNPMHEMRNMLVKALPADAVWIGSDVFHQALEENPLESGTEIRIPSPCHCRWIFAGPRS